jgi:phospholipid/cholesterol/gamma-HCH transport system permease protein
MKSYLIPWIGRKMLVFFREIGALGVLLYRIVGASRWMVHDRRLILSQMHVIGVQSLPLVTVVSLFTGAVSSWQAAYQMAGLVSLDLLGGSVSAAVMIELAPVLTGLVLAGRVGASIAAELGTMRVTEQIDALETLAIDPIRYLAAPRFMAGWFMLPVLVIFSVLIAHLGAFIVAHFMLNISTAIFFNSVQKYFSLRNLSSGLIKALVFGGGTALIGCSIGFKTAGGAEGVGRATIKAFVLSSALILVADYVLAVILF